MRKFPGRKTAKSENLVIPFKATLNTSGKGYWSGAVKKVGIKAIEVETLSRCGSQMYGYLHVYFTARTWDVNKHGLIYTDPLFLKELRAELRKQGYTGGIDYSEQGMQGDDYVHFDLGSSFIKAFKAKHLAEYERLLELS